MSKNTDFLGLKINPESKSKLDAISKKMGSLPSVVVRQLIDIFVSDPFAMVMHDVIIKSESEKANANYYLYRMNVNALKEIDSDKLDEKVQNALIEFMRILAISTGEHTTRKLQDIQMNGEKNSIHFI